MIKAVLFDMDGLMIDTERCYHDIWLQVGREWNLPITEEIIVRMRGRNRQGCEQVCRSAFGENFDFKRFHGACVQRMEADFAANGIPVKPGLKELLVQLKEKEIPAVLATSTSRATAMRYLEMAGVNSYFAGAVCGDEVAKSKPEPDIFIKAATLAGHAPQHCLVLEDSPNGVKAGAAAGCITVMIPDLTPAVPELRALTARVLPSLWQVIPLLDEL